jgi:hypothetical protein
MGAPASGVKSRSVGSLRNPVDIHVAEARLRPHQAYAPLSLYASGIPDVFGWTHGLPADALFRLISVIEVWLIRPQVIDVAIVLGADVSENSVVRRCSRECSRD